MTDKEAKGVVVFRDSFEVKVIGTHDLTVKRFEDGSTLSVLTFRAKAVDNIVDSLEPMGSKAVDSLGPIGPKPETERQADFLAIKK